MHRPLLVLSDFLSDEIESARIIPSNPSLISPASLVQTGMRPIQAKTHDKNIVIR